MATIKSAPESLVLTDEKLSLWKGAGQRPRVSLQTPKGVPIALFVLNTFSDIELCDVADTLLIDSALLNVCLGEKTAIRFWLARQSIGS